MIYVVVLLLLGVTLVGLNFFHVTELNIAIANTAHIIGGLTGVLLARLPFFSRSTK